MKKIFTLINLCLLVSCGGGDKPIELPTPPVVIPAEFSNISVPDTDGEKVISFTATSVWSIETATKAVPDWLTVSPNSGGAGSVTLTISVRENTTTSDRSAKITIKAAGQNFTITTTQKGKPIDPAVPTLSLDMSTLSLASGDGASDVAVSSNSDWTTSGVPAWITLNPATGNGNINVVLAYQANPNATTERLAVITFTADGITKTLTVTQAAKDSAVPTLSLYTSTLSLASGDGTADVAVSSNSDWTTSGVPAWITLNPTTGNGNRSVTLTCQANPNTTERSAVITFTAGSITKTLTVTQAAKDSAVPDPTISLDMSTLSLAHGGGGISIVEVSSNSDWTTSGVPAWITLTPATGNGYVQVVLEYQANPSSTTGRSAVITFTAGSITETLTVTQAPLVEELTISKSTKIVSGLAESFVLSVISNTDWHALNVPKWITLTPTNSQGSKDITVSYQTLPNDIKMREATISFKTKGITRNFVITQQKSQLPDLDVEEL